MAGFLNNPAAQPFIRSIIAAPDDDSPRLIYADWLEDRGESARAEFIRLQCNIAQKEVQLKELQEREHQILQEHGRQWLTEIFGSRGQRYVNHIPAVEDTLLDGMAESRFNPFKRGFVEFIESSLPEFVARAPMWMKKTPIRHLQFHCYEGDNSTQELIRASEQFARMRNIKRLDRIAHLDDLPAQAIQNIRNSPNLAHIEWQHPDYGLHGIQEIGVRRGLPNLADVTFWDDERPERVGFAMRIIRGNIPDRNR